MSANNTYGYIDVFGKLLKKYNTSYHRSIRISPTKASDKRTESIIWNNLYGDTPHKPVATFKGGDRVRITKKKTTFEKGYTPNWTEEVFEIVNIQNTNPVTCMVKDLNGEPVDGFFYEPELQKTTQDVFRIEKKGSQAFVKWKGYPNTFNSWVDNLTTLG
ncbi:uncharacterized protein LOC134182463 [Corticium candelabrum]|uniref:uncharacterized protein LOC134182463 n=1 Tax=Corticium candelabrum TaxID=121492 RepID=UPI002E25B7FD|nr:uncharacterized protein LOC134182463 [Corticium candelabrum]